MVPNSDEVPSILQQLKEQLDILQDSTQSMDRCRLMPMTTCIYFSNLFQMT